MQTIRKQRGWLACLGILGAVAGGLSSIRAATADPLNALIRIACGGGNAPGFRDDAPLLMSDGETYAHPVAIDRSGAANAAPEAVYQHERFAPEIVYAIPAPTPPAGKSYLVRLHFAELYDEGVGKRRQDVVINDRTVLSKFDVFADAGARNKAVVKHFAGIQPKDGVITIALRIVPGSSDANAAINGIEILADGFAPVFAPAPVKRYPFQNPSLPTAKRLDDLIGRMTLTEKVGQMRFTAPGIARLGIPPYNWWNEALHGVARAGVATVFPQAIGLASTWDTSLHFQVATAVSDEARAKYNDAIAHGNHGIYYGLTFWSPNINIFRDPRWGRGQETYGEDPYLTGRLGVAFIKGMQGDDPRYVKVVATAKHFAVHSGPESLRHVFDAQPSAYDLNDTYFPAFEAAIKEGHARSVMGAYNSLNGVPACASPFLLQETLRDRWGFTGYVVSDCGAISDIFSTHHYTKDAATASAAAVHAGCDLACDGAYGALVAAVNQKLIPEAEIDRAVRRLFSARFALGMFNPPAQVKYSKIPLSVNDSPAHRALAAQTARESIVLLRNAGNLLPLSKSLTSVAVIGPNGNDPVVLLGNYNGDTSHAVTLLEGLQKKLGDGTTVAYEKGCDIKSASRAGFDAALALAQKSDVIVAAMGISQRIEGEEGEGGIGGDRTDLNLPGVQEELLQKLVGTGKPVVLVLLNGSALAINWASEHVPGIVEAWYPGEEGGTAVADVLFGDYNPGGRLPVTFYRSADDLPAFTNYDMKGRTYRYFHGKPLYPFGYGLSYSHFVYSRLILPKVQDSNADMKVRVQVQNVSDRAGSEVVQLYLKPDVFGWGGLPLTLAGFQRVELGAHQSKTVTLTIRPEQLRLVDTDGRRTIHPGAWGVYVGGSQPDLDSADGHGGSLRDSFRTTISTIKPTH